MADRDGRGTLAELIAVFVAALADPPAEAERAMALVVYPGGGGDHIGLLMRGQPSPGGLDILATAIPARAHPQANVMLEWTLADDPPLRHYRGWAVWRDEGGFAWRYLTPAETRAQPGLRPAQPLGDDPDARFEV